MNSLTEIDFQNKPADTVNNNKGLPEYCGLVRVKLRTPEHVSRTADLNMMGDSRGKAAAQRRKQLSRLSAGTIATLFALAQRSVGMCHVRVAAETLVN